MNKALKWILSIIGVLVILVVLAIIIVPMVVDVEQYKPQIEAKASELTGRSFKLGGPLKPSVFPWVGLQLSDLHLGNPSGFEEKDFVTVKSFEVRVKLMPLLSRKIEVKRFVVDSPRIVLEKSKDGKGGWEGLGGPKTPTETTPPKDPAEQKSGDGGLPIESLMVDEFAIKNGQIIYIDQSAKTRKEVKEINLVLSDVTFDTPIGLAFSAIADNKPVSLDGTVGPLGDNPGKAPLPMDLVLKLAETLNVKLNGMVDNSSGTPRFDMAIDVAQFSPRKLLAQLQQPLPLEPADNTVLNAVSLALKAAGSPESVVITGGRMTLDDTQIAFDAQAKAFDKPDLKMKMDVDKIDLDRYLPAAAEEEASEDKAPSSAPGKSQPTDYTPLRKLVMDARLKIGEVKAKKVRLQNVSVTATAKNGVITLNPLKLDLYKGKIAGTTRLNVQKDTPRGQADISLNGIQAGPFIKDFMEKEIIEGALTAALNLSFTGDQPDLIRKTLNGKGNLKFNDGAIVGIDLANMVRNVQTAFGVGEKPTTKPRTDFAELVLPFTLTNGLFKTDGTKMNSPLLRLLATGTANLASEALDMRIEPKFVTTIKGQGDTQKRSGLAVPVLISGNFTKPKFAPDLKGLLGQKLPGKEDLEKMVPTEEDVKKEVQKKVEEKAKDILGEDSKIVEDKAKDLFKKLPFGK